MYQNIALSPLFLEGLKELSDLGFSNLLSNLLTERILVDKEKHILQEYDGKLNILDSNGQITPLKKAIIETFALNGIIKIQDQIQTKIRSEKDFYKYESEKSLALSDQTKLIITNKITDEIKLKFKLESDIEIADLNEYSMPSECSRIRAIETITKKPGQNFNFRNWLLKYIKDAKRLIIRDGYVCIGPALSDLKFLIKHINRKIPIEIHTLSDKARNWPKQIEDPKYDKVKVIERLEELKNDFSLSNIRFNIVEAKKELTERNLETDMWRINVGHAFGSVDGELVNRQFQIIVQKLN